MEKEINTVGAEDEEESSANEEESTEETGAEESKGSKGKETTASKKAGKTFTQEQVIKMMTTEKRQGKAAAFRELGIDPNDKKAISLFQSILKATKGSEDSGDGKEFDEKLAQSEARAQAAEAKAEAMKQHVQSEFVDDIAILAMNKMSAEEGSDLSTIIGEFKSKYPTWFEEKKADEDGEEEKKKAGQKGTGTSVKSKETSGKKKEPTSLGKRLAAQRKSQNVTKKSFWS